ncbi:CD151 antigen isoform X3 [Penaeus vannamei]|uniref:CD151 antigen isoform X3 n=1 Tax=Penaeus vannamei TaxID=6689 RepID=UPI000F65E736|nr:CD151 antigen-like isoform X1 [Penaeus vannamei]
MAGSGPDTSYRKAPRDRGCCSINFLKYVLFIFNFIFLLGGCAVLGVAIWTLTEKHHYVSLLTTTTYASVAYILLLAGIVVIFAALLACCAILKEDRCSLLVYTFLLLLVFLLEAVGGVLAYVYEEQVMAELSHTLTQTFNENYMMEPEVTRAVDMMQREYHCCGALTFSQWRDSRWLQEGQGINNTVPDSCCKTPSPYCGVSDHPSNIWYNGCIHQFEEELGSHLVVLGAVGCGISLVQVFGMILSCCLYIKLKDVDDEY